MGALHMFLKESSFKQTLRSVKKSLNPWAAETVPADEDSAESDVCPSDDDDKKLDFLDKLRRRRTLKKSPILHVCTCQKHKETKMRASSLRKICRGSQRYTQPKRPVFDLKIRHTRDATPDLDLRRHSNFGLRHRFDGTAQSLKKLCFNR